MFYLSLFFQVIADSVECSSALRLQADLASSASSLCVYVFLNLCILNQDSDLHVCPGLGTPLLSPVLSLPIFCTLILTLWLLFPVTHCPLGASGFLGFHALGLSHTSFTDSCQPGAPTGDFD